MTNLEKFALMSVIADRGYEAEEMTVVKNGVLCHGLRLTNPDCSEVSAVVYLSDDDTYDDVLDRVMAVMERELPVIDVHQIAQEEYILEHAYPALQRCSDENLVKRPLLNLEAYVRIIVPMDSGETGSIKVTPQYLCTSGISEDELWHAAIRNAKLQYSIRSMAEMLGMLGAPDMGTGQLYVGTSQDMGGVGASILLFPDVFGLFCRQHGERGCYVLPSSIEEVIVLPYSAAEGFVSPQDLAELVCEVNSTQVEEKLRLDPACYAYDAATNTISVVATM